MLLTFYGEMRNVHEIPGATTLERGG